MRECSDRPTDELFSEPSAEASPGFTLGDSPSALASLAPSLKVLLQANMKMLAYQST